LAQLLHATPDIQWKNADTPSKGCVPSASELLPILQQDIVDQIYHSNPLSSIQKIPASTSRKASQLPAGVERWISALRTITHNQRQRVSEIFGPKLRLTGWRMGVFGSIIGVTLVLLINLIATVWAVIKYPMEGGIGTFFTGPCENVKTMSIWVHFGINALGTLTLSSSNYTQQVLMRYFPKCLIIAAEV